MYIKSRIRVLLAEREMSQRELADRAGLTTRLVSEIINNKTKMYPKAALESIMEALNVRSLDDLFAVFENEEEAKKTIER